MKGSKVLSIILGVLMVIGGFYCIAQPLLTDDILMWFLIGAGFVSSIVNICTWGSKKKLGQANGWDLAGAIISLIVTIVLIANMAARFAAVVIVIYILMAWILIMGILKIVMSVQVKKDPVLGKGWGLMLTMGILMILAGLSGLLHPLGAGIAFGMIVGINIVVSGFTFIFGASQE